MEQHNITYTKAFAFAKRIVRAYKYLVADRREYVLARQLLRSGTSIGANVAEANGAVSRKDFANKIAIAYKECLETKYWLSLLHESDFLSSKAFESIHSDADELGAILYTIVKKTRNDR